MKRISVFIAAMLGLAIVAVAQPPRPKPFRLNGTVAGPKNLVKVYLSYMLQGDRKLDSSEVKAGQFTFSGLVEEPVLGNLRAAFGPDSAGNMSPTNYERDAAAVFLQPGTLLVSSTDSFSNITVKGSKVHDEYVLLKQKLQPLQDRMKTLSNQYSDLYKKKDTAGMKALEPAFDAIDEDIKSVYGDYVKAHPKSPIAIYAINKAAGWDINPDKVEPLMKLLPAATRDLPSAKLLADKVEVAKKIGMGRTAMDFTQNDTSGNPVSLSSFRGRYVLVDFWASWCGPCRAENPNVVKAFKTYKEKGFQVLGVSLDQQTGKEKWIKAIHDDNLTWTHVSDLKFWKNSVAVLYGIQAIPQNLLLDPEGKIIGKNLRGEELNKKLASIFASK